jgi:alcohol dehydrogenase class IV
MLFKVASLIRLTVSLPAKLTAATGMDALAIIWKRSVASYHPTADAIAASGIALTGAAAGGRGGTGQYRERSHMMAAAIMGAIAFGKGLGAMMPSAMPSARSRAIITA